MSKFKNTALHSGIGDGQDLFVKQPAGEEVTEEFKVAARARGKKRNEAEVYPKIDFQYGIHYKGRTVETYHEEPFEFDIPAYPKRVLEYDIEERRYLCYDRFWEIQADFEATVMRMIMNYAIEYEIKETVAVPLRFKICWGGDHQEDDAALFENNSSNFIGNYNQAAYKFEDGLLKDRLNRDYFSGVLANPEVVPETQTDISMTLSFRPTPFENGYAEFQWWHFENGNYNSIKKINESIFDYNGSKGGRDDDLIGFLIRGKNTSSGYTGYVFLWESESFLMSGRRVTNLEGFDIATDRYDDPQFSYKDDFEYKNASGGVPSSPNLGKNLDPTRQDNINNFKKLHLDIGWKGQHKKVYKVVNNIIQNEVVSDSGGWDFNNWHNVSIDVVGNNVKINAGGSTISFTSEYTEGSIGLCNMSQAVEYKNIEIPQSGSGGGCMPLDGFATAEEDGEFEEDALAYLRPSLEKFAEENDVDVDTIEVKNLTVQYDGDSGGGEVTLPSDPYTGPINVKLGTSTVMKTGRIPEDTNQWLEWDGVGDLTVASNATDYIEENASPPGSEPWSSGIYEVVGVNGIVKPDGTAAYDLPWSPRAENITGWFDNPISPTGPIIAHSNNPSDADVVYTATYYKCGFEEICPDNISKETGIVAVNDSNVLFAAEIAAFFNRNTYINKKRVYTLLYPVWTEQHAEIVDAGSEAVLSLGGCVIEPGKDPTYSDLIPCRPEIDDFYWDGSKLILWTCDPPAEYKTISYSYGAYAFEGEIRRIHSEDFLVPNPWTTYRLIPIVETIEELYDYVKWVGTEELEWIEPYTQIRLKTLRYFIPDWSGEWEGKNKGIVTSEEDMMFDIPPIPEKYLDPNTLTEMPHGYSGFVFLLESVKGFNLNTKIKLWWLSNPLIDTKNVDRSPSNTNKLNGTYMLRALNMADKVVVHCDEKRVYTDWVSGKFMGYGKVNGQGTLQCEGSGKADMTNISTDVVFFPDNFVEESLTGPYIDVYVDTDKIPGAEVKWKLSSDGKWVHFSSDYRGVNTWYTDWISQWVQYDQGYIIKNDGINSLGRLEDFVIASDGEEIKSVIVEKLEITNDNPFVLAWSGDLTTEQLKELSGNIDVIDIMAIKDSWVQFDTDNNPDTGKGDWSFISHEGSEMITNNRNQAGRSMWYNSEHESKENYGFRMNVRVDDTTDDDMIGAVFRFDPATKEHYAVEWDAGGTTARGLRLVRYNRNSTNTGFSEAVILARKPGFHWGFAQKIQHTIMVKVKDNNIKVYVNNVLQFNVEDNSIKALSKGAWGPMTYSQPKTFFWDLQMFELHDSPEVFAKIKDLRPYDWSPMIHNGYYYDQDKEHYLYAEKIVNKVTPNIKHEVIVSPIPKQGAPIIVQDNEGRNLRKVMFFDENYEPSLSNTEVFNGNGNSAYYLSYMGIDEGTLIVTVNDEIEEYIFEDEKSRIEFMRKITEEDTIKAYYQVLYSYIIDMNYDIAGNRAKITLQKKYDPSEMIDMTVTYEAAEQTPFYRAKEITFNPLLNHNHAGFLFITNEEQIVKDVSINISPRTLEVNPSRRVLITAKVLDEFGNPAVGKEVTLFRNGAKQLLPAIDNVTNSSGEVYFYFSPILSAADVPNSHIDEYVVKCDSKSDTGILNYYVSGNMDRKYIDIQLSKEAIVGGTSDFAEATITLRDKDFKKMEGKIIRVELTHTNGSKTTNSFTISSSKEIKFKIEGTGQKQGYVYIKATHDMGTEDAVTLKAVKVLGG